MIYEYIIYVRTKHRYNYTRKSNWFLAFIAATCSKYTILVPSNTPSPNPLVFSVSHPMHAPMVTRSASRSLWESLWDGCETQPRPAGATLGLHGYKVSMKSTSSVNLVTGWVNIWFMWQYHAGSGQFSGHLQKKGLQEYVKSNASSHICSHTKSHSWSLHFQVCHSVFPHWGPPA